MTLNAQSSKAEEKEVLKKMVVMAGESSYLSAFLNKKMVEWLEGQINDDFSCDIFDAYLATDMEKLILARTNDALIKEDKCKTNEIIKVNASLEESHNQITDLYQQLADAFDTLNAKDGEIYKITTEVQMKNAEIINLKAKLWDLTQKE